MAPGTCTALRAEREDAPDTASFERDLRTGEAEYSPALRRILAVPRGLRLTREALLERAHPEDLTLIEDTLTRAQRRHESFVFEVRVVRFDEVERTVRVRGRFVYDADGQPQRVVGAVDDVTDESGFGAARERLTQGFVSSDDAIITRAVDGTITSWNRGAELLYGYTAEEAIGSPGTMLEPAFRAGEEALLLRQVFAGTSIGRVETERVHRHGDLVAVSLTMSPVPDVDGRIVAVAVVARDTAERRHYEARLRYLADYDQLTGIYNRRRFEEELKRTLARSGHHHATGAVLTIDLDNFKSTNDSAGPAAGDAVLAAVGRVLKRRFRATDTVARLGGDEFGVLLAGVGVAAARKAAEDLLMALHTSRPMFGGKSFRITASIGVAAFESDDATAGELLVNAELAMYAAKSAGRDRVVLYTALEGRQARQTAKLTWAERIRDALDRDDGFVLHVQPILDLVSGRVSHGELLLRMRDEYGNLIPPGTFLPAAERFGLIHAIDRWVVRRAIHVLGQGRRPLPMGVNLSGDSVVGDPRLLEVIERELAEASVDPSLLIFEITETAAIANMPEARLFASRLNDLGSSLAIDDFGTGFGSLYYLKHLPVSFVKLDGEFIHNLPRSEIDRHMVGAIVGIARGLGIKTVAESVSDEETVELLRQQGVDYAQGFHVGRPEPV
jgi:diguanylate cyclase (GGDEF)-like protein/PAS domain S-box-containing protein